MIHWRYAGPAVLAVVVVCVILAALAVIRPELAKEDWVSARDVVRTVLIALGFGLAALTYYNWRRPDDTKRAAETAQEMIRHSMKVESALIASRIAQAVYAFDSDRNFVEPDEGHLIDALEDSVTSRDNEKIARAQELALEFLGFETEARVFFGSECAGMVRTMFKFSQDIHMAFLMAPHFYNGFQFNDPEKRVEVLKSTLRTLGIRKHMHQDDIADPYETEIQAAGRALREKLVKFVVKYPMA